jgi:hypothetical protein
MYRLTKSTPPVTATFGGAAGVSCAQTGEPVMATNATVNPTDATQPHGERINDMKNLPFLPE